MKLSTRDAAAFIARPAASRAGVLIYGPDAMRVTLKRQELLANLLGPGAEEEMRLARLTASDLRGEPGRLADEVRSPGFFPGARAVFLDGATNAHADAVATALAAWSDGDATLVVAAGQLAAKAQLRKLFEAHPNAFAIAVYDDPPTREEVERLAASAGLADIATDGMAALTDLSRALDPGDFRQTVGKIGLWKRGDATPLTADEVALSAPASVEAAVDDAIHVVAEARTAEIGPVLARLAAQGTTPVSLVIGATRHFRALHAAASDPGGPSAGIGRLRPPVYGPRRDRMERQAKSWGRDALEAALGALMDADLTLRSAARAPDMAVVERTFVRLASMAARRR